MRDVYIVSFARTPQGSFGGMLAGMKATELGSLAIKGAIEKAGIPAAAVNEVFMGNVVSANVGQAPVTQAMNGAGMPSSIPGTTVNKVCASGAKATMFGMQSIQLGINDIVVCGGMESMSNAPYYVEKGRYGYGYGHGQFLDSLVRDGLSDPFSGIAMGVCGDNTAKALNISREAQDEFAARSFRLAAENTQNGNFKNEIIPIGIPQRKGDPVVMTEDEGFKKVVFDKIPTLKPVFTKEGTVTAANASTINDGACALVLASGDKVKELGLKPIAKIVSYGDASQDSEWFTTTPAIAANVALKRVGLNISDIDYYEVNEAFAVVVLAFAQAMKIDIEKINVFGGAIAIGHPIGCSGARIIGTLANVLQAKGGRYGLMSICNGGGGASAVIIERV